ncbi:MAG: NAD-dependent epimerase/dehydratase family protein [Bryobacteraceae bacterium]|nr:NAD-dependent epimerase/dehydratase family protein [Bryobacteraceae bacterium]
MRTAVIAGASGLVGGYCLAALLKHYDRVLSLGRRPNPTEAPNLEQRQSDFESPPSLPPGADVFCALGTTIRRAGSREAFRKVDFEYALRLAQAAAGADCPRFLIVSSAGANPASGNFYLKTKGEVEAAVSALPIPEVHIFRPGVLDGPRLESRPGERIGLALAKLVGPLLAGGLSRYRATPAEAVGRAMVAVALRGETGRHVYHWREILARSESEPGVI